MYQWVELLAVRAGKTPACAINETVNCATVWNSAFSAQLHDTLGMPIAALGVIYGLVGLALTGFLAYRARAGSTDSTLAAAVKVWAALGVLSCVMFGAASFQAHAVCITCLGTYVLTAVYAFGAFGLLPGPAWPASAALIPGASWALVFSVPVYLCLLVPGSRTPKSAPASLGASVAKQGLTSMAELDQFIAGLPERDQLALSYARATWLASQPLDNTAFPVRIRRGPANAPVRIVDFTDIRCPHCRVFEDVLHEVERVTPEGTISIEPRYYPLDGECNPELAQPGVVSDGVRCLAAQVQICLESNPSFYDVRHTLFENQQNLTKDFIMQTASAKSGLSTDALLTCAKSAETTAKLRQDLEYAQRYKIEGTPLVLINDKVAPAAPVFILGMAVSKGDANASYFTKLPPPPAE